MGIMRSTVTILFTLLTAAAVARADAGGAHVKVDLLADTAAVQAGKPFTLGVRFKIDFGWHIYWTNPGDSGLPTRVKLDLPPGFTAGPVQYPVPEALKLPGDITNYAYERQLLLLVPVTPPATLAAAAVPIVAHAGFLVCNDVCLPGKADVNLALPAGAPTPANADLFRTWEHRLPGSPPTGYTAEWDRKPAPDDSAYHVRIIWPTDAVPRDVQWLPPAPTGFDLEDVHVATSGTNTDLDYKLVSTGKDVRPPQADGLIVYSDATGTRKGFAFPIYPSQEPGSHKAEQVVRNPIQD
jgi:DsbC/DsbD-like thiol-disulfide interchange protein